MRHISFTFILAVAWILFENQPAFAQTDISAIVVRHLTIPRATSR